MKRLLIVVLTVAALQARAGAGPHYVLVLRESAAGAGAEVAATYGATIGRATDDTILEVTVSESQGRLLARDPRVQQMTVAATTAWTAGVAYEYDGAGNMTSVGDDSFIYDSVDRLVSGTSEAELMRSNLQRRALKWCGMCSKKSSRSSRIEESTRR